MLKIERVFDTPVWLQANNEEGTYDYHAGWNIVVTVMEGRIRHTYVLNESEELFRYFTLEQAGLMERMLDRIHQRGFINPEHWTLVESNDLDALPDYVLNPWRPEYN